MKECYSLSHTTKEKDGINWWIIVTQYEELSLKSGSYEKQDAWRRTSIKDSHSRSRKMSHHWFAIRPYKKNIETIPETLKN